jgi:PAS domain S-box-containing protein
MQKKIKLLIVEDDSTQVFLIRESLNTELYELSVIDDGLEALDFLLSTSEMPELVLMDYHLPSVDGLTILNKLKENGLRYNVVFLTADYSIETAVNSINAGALDFIPKDGRFVNNIAAIVEKACQTIKARHEREEFEFALRESETRFKMVMDASKDGIFEWNSLTSYSHVSPNLVNLLGYTVENYPKGFGNFMSIVHPDDKENLIAKFEEHAASNSAFYEAEVRLRTFNGNYKWILERGIIAQKDATGIPVRVIGTHSDISERKANEKKIIEANQKLTTLIGNLPGIVYSCPKSNIFNKSFIGGKALEITGFTDEELLGDSFINIVYPEDVSKIEEQVKQSVDTNSEYGIYYRIISKSEQLRWVFDHGKLVQTPNNTEQSIEGYITDITEKHISDEALRQSEEEKNIILDNSLQAFVLLSPEGKIIAFNKVANHRTIITAGKTLKKGSLFFDFINEPEKERTQSLFNRVIQGEPAYWEQPTTYRDDTNWFENILVPVFVSRDEIKFVCYTSTDITERKLAEEKIINSESLYNTTINSFNDLLFVVNFKLELLLANEAMIKFNQNNNIPIPQPGKKITDFLPFLMYHNNNSYFEVFQTGNEVLIEENLSIGEKPIIIEIKITPVFQQKKVIRAVTVIRDITERKNFEKRIMNAIIETEERERKRFSEDLHDELGSILSTIKIYINTIHQEELEVQKRKELVEFTNQLINQAIQNSKEIANNLSPNVIKRFGLITAIQSYCEKIQLSASINVYFNASEFNQKLKEDSEISIYRVISELLNNTVKHAGATEVEIIFKSINEKLNIIYSDNGKGFDFEKTITENTKGLGLQNIVSRINSLNGTYKVSSEPNKGFIIKTEVVI